MDTAPLPALDATLRHALKARIAGSMPALVRAAVEALNEDEIWRAPREGMNAPGTLVRHCASALRYFVVARITGGSFQRDRDDEFSARPEITKAELLTDWDAVVDEVRRTIDALPPDALAGVSVDAERRYSLLGEDLLAATVHLSVHAGQLVLLARLYGHGFGDDLWGTVHRASGAMRPPPPTS